MQPLLQQCLQLGVLTVLLSASHKHPRRFTLQNSNQICLHLSCPLPMRVLLAFTSCSHKNSWRREQQQRVPCIPYTHDLEKAASSVCVRAVLVPDSLPVCSETPSVQLTFL